VRWLSPYEITPYLPTRPSARATAPATRSVRRVNDVRAMELARIWSSVPQLKTGRLGFTSAMAAWISGNTLEGEGRLVRTANGISRQALGPHHEKETHARDRQPNPEQSSHGSEDEALEEEVACKLGAFGAYCGPQRNLPLTALHPDQHEIGRVGDY
jgi:hypothetical protein